VKVFSEFNKIKINPLSWVNEKEIIDMMDKNNSDDRDSVIEKIKLKKRENNYKI